MTSSTKPEAHNSRNAANGEMSRGHIGNMQKKLLKFGRVVFVLFFCERTDRQTDILITVLSTRPGEEVRDTDSNLDQQAGRGWMGSLWREMAAQSPVSNGVLHSSGFTL